MCYKEKHFFLLTTKQIPVTANETKDKKANLLAATQTLIAANSGGFFPNKVSSLL